ncbi:hypothetical protein HY212_04005 [Candidatus Pacearchaeota archaeon]|nr:hypothetical protein [Candidatus Pacearchaeota archaeon]
MKIITKYYDNKDRLRLVKNSKNFNCDSAIRLKILENKEFPCCDFKGKCTNFAYAEVYPVLMKKGKKGWSYLCKRHYFQEEKKLKWKLPASLSVEW